MSSMPLDRSATTSGEEKAKVDWAAVRADLAKTSKVEKTAAKTARKKAARKTAKKR